jgi:hypothetical protein
MLQRPALMAEFQIGEIKDVVVRELPRSDDPRDPETIFRMDD